ncbi:MAG: LLM class flavin-dependent oxidoreductase [Thermomicrobium sp.]|nr:LLM class flavin-dependent oxidoreductase [Thermomicrobium sp.]MDW8060453.1 LLM class flavin-dependent oxidoreductase [Thermomicrobium sp.]
MRFGIHVGPQNTTVEELRRLWRFADERGFDWFSVWDHFYARTSDRIPHFEAVSLLAAIASETTRIRFGCMVFAVQFRNIGLLAKSIVTIDHLSGGRLEVGLGAGWHEPEYRAFGYPFLSDRERLDQLEEGIQALRRLLEVDAVTFEGRWVQLREARVLPKPIQPRLPLWIGGAGERRTARIAVRHADGWNIPYIDPEGFRLKKAALEHWCAVEGRDPKTIQVAVQVGLYMAPEDDDRAVARLRERLAEQVGPQALQQPGWLVGGPSGIAEQLRAYREAGVDWINVTVRPPVDFEALEAFVERVMPVLR